MTSDEPAALALLREAGLRVTAQRCAVLEWLLDHPHATAEEVGLGVRDRLRSISKQAVYDVLTTCVAAGLVRRIEPAGHPARFERRIDDNHHHLVCRGCGTIEDVDCVVGARPCLTAHLDPGFLVEEAEVVFWGTCPTCRGKRDAGPGVPERHAAEPRVREPDGAAPQVAALARTVPHRDQRHSRDATEV